MIKVNINKANAQDLCKIIHIGEKRAGQIIAGRKYRDVHEISKVVEGIRQNPNDGFNPSGLCSCKRE